jgi:lysophospholipase L1-like esterase
MMRRFEVSFLIIAGALAVTACVDEPSAPIDRARLELSLQTASAGALFEHYVAIGTSISAGFASEGLSSVSQVDAWPAQLARVAGKDISLPLIAFPGCRPPFAVPLASFVRVSGESVGIPLHLVSCSPNEAGTTLPTANVSVPGAKASDALAGTPENRDPLDANTKIYPRILPSNTTQVQAMLAQQPRLVSVELGINEVLGARNGHVTGMTKFAVFARNYDEVLARVRDAAPEAVVLVGLVKDLATVPAFRTGSEIWADRGTFLAAFHVDVSADCNGSPNLITVPFRVPAAVAAGVTARGQGQPPMSFSCQDGGPTASDFVLTPAEVAIAKDILARMNAHIKRRAAQYGYAHFELQALYGLQNLKPPYSVVALMTSATPYGTYLSLDGFHPSALGQTILATAAAHALNARYGLDLSTPVTIANVLRQ